MSEQMSLGEEVDKMTLKESSLYPSSVCPFASHFFFYPFSQITFFLFLSFSFFFLFLSQAQQCAGLTQGLTPGGLQEPYRVLEIKAGHRTSVFSALLSL